MVLATEKYWLEKVKALELRVSELEMALDYQRAKAMGKE
jgi:hypothetical protein